MCTEQCGSLQFSRCEHELPHVQVAEAGLGGLAGEPYGSATFDPATSGPRWRRHGQRLVLVSAMLAGSVGLLNASQAMAAECTDTDGDGWGWDGFASCEMSTGSNPVERSDSESGSLITGPCADSGPSDDAWGWNGVESCRLDASLNREPHCLDVGAANDGWGWDGFESCEIPIEHPTERYSINQLPVTDGAETNNAPQSFIAADRIEGQQNEAIVGSVGGAGNAGSADSSIASTAPATGLPAGAVEVPAGYRSPDQTVDRVVAAADTDEFEGTDSISRDGSAGGGVGSTAVHTQPETGVPTSESTTTSVEIGENGNHVEVTRDVATGEIVGTFEVGTDDDGREVVSITTPSGQTTTTTDLETNISISTFTNDDVETTVVSNPETGVTETTVQYSDGTVETQIDSVTYSANEVVSPDGSIRSDIEFATGDRTVTETDGETTTEHNWSPSGTGGTGYTVEDGVVTSTYSTVENPDGTRTETHVEDGVRTETVYDGDQVVSQEETTAAPSDLTPEAEDDDVVASEDQHREIADVVASEDQHREIADVVATQEVSPTVDIHQPFEFAIAPSGPAQTIPSEAVVAEDVVSAVGAPVASDWEVAVAIEAMLDGTATLAQLEVVSSALRDQPDLVVSTDPAASPVSTERPAVSESPVSDEESTVTTVNTHRDVHSLPSIDAGNNGGDTDGGTAQGAADTYSGGDLGGEFAGL